jgi:hypothetical protein
MAKALLSGKFLIRTFRTGNFVTARDSGHHSIDALISSATVPGPNEVFNCQAGDNFQNFMFTAGNFIVSARNGGGIGASDDTETFQTEARDFRDDEKFIFNGPEQDGTFSVQTLTGNFVTAVGGGGHSSRAFHTDATQALAWEKFFLLRTGDLTLGHLHQYAIRPIGTNVGFLTAINGGNRKVQAMTANSPLVDNSRFRLEKQADGTFAIGTPMPFHFVTADDGGGLAHGSPQIDNLITTQTQVKDWEKFRIQETSPGVFTIQTVSGFFIGVKNDLSNISTRISFPDEAPSIGYSAKFELTWMGVP